MRVQRSRAEKSERKLKGIKPGVGLSLDTAQHTVNVYAITPVVVPGFLVSKSSNFVVFRHRRTSASKKTVTTTFPRSQVISVTGEVGEISQLVITRRALIDTYRGTVKINDKSNTVTITDPLSSEPTTFYIGSSFDVDVIVDEDEKAQKVSKRLKSKSKTGSDDSETVKTVKKKKKKRVEQFDDDGDL